MAVSEDIELRDDLEETALKQFDTLVEDGSIFYEPSQPETIEHNGFQVSLSHKLYVYGRSKTLFSSNSGFCHTSTRSRLRDQIHQAEKVLEVLSLIHVRQR